MAAGLFIYLQGRVNNRGRGQAGIKRLPSTAPLFIVLSLLSMALLLGCATNSDLDTIKNDVNQLKGDASELKKETAEIKGDMLALKGLVSQAAKEESFNALRESQMNIYSQVSDYSKDIQVLKGRFDEYKFFVDKALKESSVEKELLRAQVSGLEGRIKELNEKLAKLIETKAPDLPQKPASENGSSAEKAKDAKEAPDDPAKTYEEAYKAFKDKQFSDSREKFNVFIKKFPKDELAGNARFWIAESHYAEKDFESAILDYEALIKDYPDNKKIPAALFKQGLSFVEIGDKKTARIIFGRLIEKYPATAEADKAREKEAEMDKKPAKKTKSNSKSKR